jgi:lipopolysaccharide assembly outer membrane protein LptD (OstA)
LTLIDEKGRTIVEVTARAGAVGPGKAGTQTGGVVGSLSGGTAVLYQEGKPAAKLTADSVRAEQETRTVVAKGNATVTSLADPNTPAIRADTMTWRYETGTIKGTGNVLVTRKPDLRIPGTSFSADTRLHSFTLNGGAGPATGTL